MDLLFGKHAVPVRINRFDKRIGWRAEAAVGRPTLTSAKILASSGRPVVRSFRSPASSSRPPTPFRRLCSYDRRHQNGGNHCHRSWHHDFSPEAKI